MQKDELQKILKRHTKWINDIEGGKRANLSGADLTGACLSKADLTGVDLTGADLSKAHLTGVNGNLQHIKNVFLDTYPITYTASVMQIGCKCHDIEKWWAFSDAEIEEMDGVRALKWWQKYKPFLQQIIALSPADPTKEPTSRMAQPIEGKGNE